MTLKGFFFLVYLICFTLLRGITDMGGPMMPYRSIKTAQWTHCMTIQSGIEAFLVEHMTTLGEIRVLKLHSSHANSTFTLGLVQLSDQAFVFGANVFRNSMGGRFVDVTDDDHGPIAQVELPVVVAPSLLAGIVGANIEFLPIVCAAVVPLGPHIRGLFALRTGFFGHFFEECVCRVC